MVVIKHLGKVEGQTKIYLQLFGYAKRHEEKRHGNKLFKESVTWQNLILSYMRSLLLYIYIYILIASTIDWHDNSRKSTINAS